MPRPLSRLLPPSTAIGEDHLQQRHDGVDAFLRGVAVSALDLDAGPALAAAEAEARTLRTARHGTRPAAPSHSAHCAHVPLVHRLMAAIEMSVAAVPLGAILLAS